MTKEEDFKKRSEKVLEKVGKILKEYQVSFLPRIDYKKNGEAHVVIALFDAKPQEEPKAEEKKDA